MVRESEGAVHRTRLDAAWSEDEQRARCLAALVEDGLLAQVSATTYALP